MGKNVVTASSGLKYYLLPVLAFFTGCAQNSGVIPMGNDTYMVSRQAASGFGGMGTLKAEAMQEAFNHCTFEKSYVDVVRIVDAQPPFILGNFPKTDVFFKCLSNTSMKSKANPETQKKQSTGSGFIISNAKHIITNEHVVNDCENINIRTNYGVFDANIIATDQANDIAILSAPNIKNKSYAKFRDGYGVRVGEDVTTVGFPLGDLLGTSVKVTSGSISSITGLGNDSSRFQIDAAIQPGNSGGPLLDNAGNIIGIVTSKLNDIAIVKLTGSLPQNVNFAIKSPTVLSFLSSHKINFYISDDRTTKTRPEIVEEAEEYTVMVQCN
jgi:S1-C subfamily serine protease